MTDYPNREHGNADGAARTRALKALDDIMAEVGYLRAKLGRESRPRVDAGDAEVLNRKVFVLAGSLAELDTLHNVREWDAADRAQAEAEADNWHDEWELAGRVGDTAVLKHRMTEGRYRLLPIGLAGEADHGSA